MPHIYITRLALVSNNVLDSCKDCYVNKSQPELAKDENYNNFKRKAGVFFKHIIHQNINSITELHFECAISPNILRNHLDKSHHFMTGKPEIQRLSGICLRSLYLVSKTTTIRNISSQFFLTTLLL